MAGSRMTDITPKTRLEGQRGHVIHTSSWESLVDFYRDRIAHGLRLEPMLHLVAAIGASPIAPQLFGATSMFDLMLSDCADFRFGDSTLCIAYTPSDRVFEFRHHTFSGHDDHKTCGESESLQMLRLFLRLK